MRPRPSGAAPPRTIAVAHGPPRKIDAMLVTIFSLFMSGSAALSPSAAFSSPRVVLHRAQIVAAATYDSGRAVNIAKELAARAAGVPGDARP